ncbi:MAG: acetoin utilization protein AcuC [Candidatus Latescibacteria bacterium]|nr:acetoin utilization protein AcuC [Candidatus Latescibacterota bacterium]
MRKAVFIHSPQLEEYHYPSDCPFDISRAGKTRTVLNSMGLLSGNGRSEIVPIRPERILLKKFHSAHYLHVLKTAAKEHWGTEAVNMGIGTPDCPVFKGMYDCAVLSCGGTLTAAKLILSGATDVAFNPSGGFHHAGPECAAGFCYINDVALACMILAEEGKRVLYLDVDVHHGDGVQNAFYDRSDVMTISFHESPKTLFPGTGFEDEIGTGQGRGHCVNVPLPVGTHDQAYMKAFKAIALPLIAHYNPDVIVFELGADALAGDPLAHLYLTNNVYTDIISLLMRFNKPILATGGGGYNIDNTVRAWALAWSVLCGADSQDMNLCVGGVMLKNTDWQGGLRDRILVVSSQQRDTVTPQIEATIEAVKANIFSLHGL